MEETFVVDRIREDICLELSKIESVNLLEYFLEFIKEAATIWV